MFAFIKVGVILKFMIGSETTVTSPSPRQHPLLGLKDEELDLVLQLVLASGSLKDLAGVYKVSYPTIRARVDKLIERVRQIAGGTSSDPMMQLLADLVERGEIAVPAARAVRDLYRQQMAEHEEAI
jgi:hypothetical protein